MERRPSDQNWPRRGRSSTSRRAPSQAVARQHSGRSVGGPPPPCERISPTHPGGTLSLSANGATAGSGVLWATFTSTKVDTTSGHQGDAWHYLVPGVLYAYDANTLTTPIWTSTANKARDDLGLLAKFNAPTVANGKVYVGSQVAPQSDTSSTAAGKLQVYGLLP